MTRIREPALLRCLRKIAASKPTEAIPDRMLLQRFARWRDEAAFAILVERYGPLVLGLCRRILRHDYDAEDAFQAVFFVLARKAGMIRKSESVGSWLYGVAYRLALKSNQRIARRRDRESILVDVPASEESPRWLGSDVRPVLEEEVNRLPSKYRDPFVLCHFDGLTNEQAAARLGCPLGTVLSRLSRARQRLRHRLTRRGVTLCAAALLLSPVAARAVAPALFASTTRAAIVFAKEGACPFVSHTAAALAQGEWSTMVLTRIGFVVGALLLGAIGAAGLAGTRAAPVDSVDPPEIILIAGDRLTDKLEEEWKRVLERKQDENPWMDKIDFAGTYDDMKGEKPFTKEELKSACEQFTKLAQMRSKDADYGWRVQQLLGHLRWDLGESERAIEHNKKALEMYPAKEYAEPSKHSFYQHLANDTAGMIWESKGVAEAEQFILELFKKSPKFQYFFTHYWQDLYMRKAQPERYEPLVEKVLEAYEAKIKNEPKSKDLYQSYMRGLKAAK